VEVIEDTSAVGGGALPLAKLPTYVVAVKLTRGSISHLAEVLRRAETPLDCQGAAGQASSGCPHPGLDDDFCLIPAIIKSALDEPLNP
jgi:hypothetical protein